MFHYDWRHVTAEQERREDEISRMRRRRRADGHSPAAPRAPKFHHRFLAYLGRRLVDLGWQLQSPYNRMTVSPGLGSRSSDPNLRLNC